MNQSGVNVRASASTSGTVVGTQSTGQQGTVIGGPTTASGYTWYNVDWSSGADGWSADLYMEIAPAVPTAPGDTSSPGPAIAAPSTFSWSAVNGAEGYGLYIRDVNTGSNVFSNDGAIKAGTSYNVSPAIFTSGHAYRWVTSSFNGSTEGVLQSNYRYFQVASNAPDLTASNVTANMSTVNPGDTITVNYTLQNLGGAAPQSQTKLALVNPNNVSQVLVSTTYAEGAIGANSSQARSGTLTVPAGAVGGTYQVRVILDNQSSIGQTVVNNDIVAGPNVTVQTIQQKPNLVPSGVTVLPSSVQAGGSMTVNWRMDNTGSGAAAATSTGIRIGTSNTTHPPSSGISNVATGAIAAGSHLDQNATITVPAGTVPGTYYVWVIADNSVPGMLDQSSTADDWAVSGAFTVASATTVPAVNGDISLRLPWRTGEAYRVTQGYGAPGGDDHTGYQVDFGLPSGTPVVSAYTGTVVETGDYAGNSHDGIGLTPAQQGGIYVKLVHQGATTQWYSSYLHLSSRLVDVGDTVSTGQVIGYSGNTGWSTGAHLHFHIRNGPTSSSTGYRPVPMAGVVASTGATIINDFVEGETYRAIDSTTSPKPNLVPLNVKASPSTVQAGGSLAVNWRMSNAGTGGAAATVTGIRIGTSSTTHPSASGTLNASFPTGTIAAGSFLDQSTTVTVPASMGPGTYYIWVIADNSVPGALDQTRTDDDWAVSGAISIPVIDPVTTYSISPNATSVREDAGSLAFTVTRSGATLPAETVYASTVQGSANGYASNVGDYATNVSNLPVTFAAGQSTATVTVTILNDTVSENNETFGFIVQQNQTDPLGTYLAKTTFTITDDDGGNPAHQTGVDYSFTRPSPAALHAAGYSFAIRYLGGSASKDITSSEASALRNAGLQIALVFEDGAGRMLTGFSAGVADANTAISQATAAGAPQNFFCYFACDFDAQLSDQASINSYLDGVASVMPLSRIGFYGGYWPLKRVLDAGKASKGWQTSAWSGGLIDSRISLYQYDYHVTLAGDPTNEFDLDEAYQSNFGQWDGSMQASYSISPNATSVREDAGSLAFTVTRSDATLPAETVYASTVQGSANGYASNVGDYATNVSNLPVTFAAGQSTATVTVTILNDTVSENNETFGFIVQQNQTDPLGTYLAKTTFTITDDDVQDKPNLAPSSVTVSPSSVQASGSMTVNWRMDNSGSGAAAATSTGIRIGASNTTHPGTSGIPNVSTGAIAAGSHLDQNATITVPAGTAPGTYYVWVIADNSNPVVLDQTTQADDWAVSGAFTVTGNVVPTMSAATPSPSTVAAGANLTVNYSVSASTATNLLLGASLQAAGGGTTYDLYYAAGAPIALTAGDNTFSRTYQVSATTPSGTYDLLVILWQDTNGNGVIDTDTEVSRRLVAAAVTVTPTPSTPPLQPINVSPASAFVDDFNRPDSATAGNGWFDLAGGSGALGISGGRLALVQGGSTGVYRPVHISGPVHVAARVYEMSGFYSYQLNRYVASFRIGNDGQIGHGYGVTFSRSDSDTANSEISVWDGAVKVGTFAPTLQFGHSIDVDFTVASDGSIHGTLSQADGTFEFSFGPHAFQQAGEDFSFSTEYNPTGTPPRLDDLTIGGVSEPAAVSLTPTLTASLFADPDAGDAHASSQWVVMRKTDMVVVFDSGEDQSNLTSITVTPLAPSTEYVWKVRYRDSRGTWSEYSNPTSFTTTALLAPTLTAMTVNDGAAQRSQVKSLTLAFDQTVSLAPGAVRLELLNTDGSGSNNGAAPTDASTALASPNSTDGGKTWVFTFAAASEYVQKTSTGNPTGSLVDGIFLLSIDPTKVTAAGGVAMTNATPFKFHRLFGDVNGSGSVKTLDYGMFRNSFGRSPGQPGYEPAFDFDGNGVVNNSDYGQFRTRYGRSFIP